MSINIPFERNPYFTGRDAILAQLRVTFFSRGKGVPNLPQVISGLGGIGKTQLAIEYVYRFQEEYQYIFWLRASTEELLFSDFADIADILDLPIKRDENQNIAIATVKRWLETHNNWLLVLDNVPDVEKARNFLASGLQGHVLFTARTSVVGNTLLRVEPGTMTPEDGILFLLRRAGIYPIDAPFDTILEVDQQHAKAVADTMGYLPLALDQAAAYIEKTNCGLVGYVSRYELRRTKLLSERGNSGTDHPEPVATTWSLSFGEVEQKSPVAADLLRLCAFLHPDAIPEEMLSAGASELTPALQEAVTDLFELDDTIVTLYEYSLIRRNQDEKTLAIHRLVQTVLKDSMDVDTQQQWAERTVRMVNRALPDVSFEGYDKYKQYLSHIQTCAMLIQQWKMSFPEALRLLTQSGHYLHESGQYKDAEYLLQQLLAIQEQTLGEHLDVASTVNELGELARRQAKYAQSVPLHQRALAIREHLLEADHPDVATSLNNLARPYHHFAQYLEAESLYQKALKIREKALGLEHADVADSLNDLAVLYSEQGRYQEAIQLHQRALKIRERVLGPEHPNTANSLVGIAGVYQLQGRYKEAESLLQRALKTQEQVLGPEHPNTANSLVGVATVYQLQGRYKEAEPLLQRALKIQEQVLGPEHPNTANSLSNIAAVYQWQGRDINALKFYQKALAIRMKALGSKHPDTASSLNGLAVYYTAKNNFKEAEPLFQRALKIQEQVLGLEHPDVANTLMNYASMLMKAKRKGKAEAMEARAKVIQAKHEQENSSTVDEDRESSGTSDEL